MNEEQKLRLELLAACNYDIEAARKCWDFVYGKAKKESACDRLSDGIYLINDYGEIVPFDGKERVSNGLITHIGIVRGDHSVAIALHDVSEYGITLTSKTSDKDHGGYKDNYMDAVQDWDGAENTERLKLIGLNPAIQLKDGEYIPTLAELYLICLNRKTINAAMRFAGGQELEGWYWSSTEFSATTAWYLSLYKGSTDSNTKATLEYRVRPVKKFM